MNALRILPLILCVAACNQDKVTYRTISPAPAAGVMGVVTIDPEFPLTEVRREALTESSITGLLENASGRDAYYYEVQCQFYDRSGVRIGYALDNGLDLKAGDVARWSLEDYHLEGKVASWLCKVEARKS